MREEFLGVLLMLVVAIVLAVFLLVLPRWLGDRAASAVEDAAPPVSPREQFSTKFFVAAAFFLLLEGVVLLLVPWAALFRELGASGLAAVTSFLTPVAVGVFYYWRKGALEW